MYQLLELLPLVLLYTNQSRSQLIKKLYMIVEVIHDHLTKLHPNIGSVLRTREVKVNSSTMLKNHVPAPSMNL